MSRARQQNTAPAKAAPLPRQEKGDRGDICALSDGDLEDDATPTVVSQVRV